MSSQRVFAMSFAKVYPLYIQKAEKKGRTKEEVISVFLARNQQNSQAQYSQLLTLLSEYNRIPNLIDCYQRD